MIVIVTDIEMIMEQQVAVDGIQVIGMEAIIDTDREKDLIAILETVIGIPICQGLDIFMAHPIRT